MAKQDDSISATAGCLFLILVIAVGVGVSAFCGFLTMIVLSAFGIHYSFWICWACWILISGIFGRASSSK